MTRLVSWGELLWDLFPDGARLGGGAANVAYHASLLGARAALVSRVGDDALGRRALTELSSRGVDVSAVQIDADAPTGSVRVELAQGEPRFTLAQGAAWDRIEQAARGVAGRSERDLLWHLGAAYAALPRELVQRVGRGTAVPASRL